MKYLLYLKNIAFSKCENLMGKRESHKIYVY